VDDAPVSPELTPRPQPGFLEKAPPIPTLPSCRQRRRTTLSAPR
jgi:hypothetical protein